MWVRILTLKCAVFGCHGLMNNSTNIRHISDFLETEKTAGAYSIQIYDYLSQIQRKIH